jgi:hypothetical protein
MKINEIFEKNSPKEIFEKTTISEENIKILSEKNFKKLKKVRALGFISIFEREYKEDLSHFRDEALAFYAEQGNIRERITLDAPIELENRSKSKLFLPVLLAILALASWYFFSQYSNEHRASTTSFDQPINEELSQRNMTTEVDDVNGETTKIEDITKNIDAENKKLKESNEQDSKISDLNKSEMLN